MPYGAKPQGNKCGNQKNLQQKGIKDEKRPVLAEITERAWRKYPAKKLLARIGLDEYATNHAALMKEEIKVDEVTLPLKQHIGVPASPTMGKGSKKAI